MLIFGATTPGLEKDKIRTGCYSCGSATFGKFTLSCVAALCVCARDGHRNTGSFGKKRPQDMPFPMPNTQTFRPGITQAKAVPRCSCDRPPPPPTPKGSRRFTGHGRLAHTKPKKFRGGVKTARPVLRIPQQVSQGHSEALALWISFPPGKLETEGRSDKTAASCARGISLHPWYAGQLSAIHFWDRYTQIANRLGIWK